jgi:Cu/Zn superoxide dismutase
LSWAGTIGLYGIVALRDFISSQSYLKNTVSDVFVLKMCALLQHAGDLGNITAAPDGRATFRLTDKVLKVWDVVGRAVVVTDGADDLGRGNHPRSSQDGNSGQRLVAFIK